MGLTPKDCSPRQVFRFVPSCTSRQADQGNRIGVVVRRLPALLEELVYLFQGQKGQFGLIGLDLADIGQRVDA
ncbi:hypothetical protein D3C85_1336680 [compost metagenome]